MNMNIINEAVLENVNGGGGINYGGPHLHLQDVIDFFTPKNAFEYKPGFMPDPFDFNRINDI